MRQVGLVSQRDLPHTNRLPPGPGLSRGDTNNTGISIKHRGKRKQFKAEELKQLKRRQAIESVVEHLKQEHRIDRCHLKGALGDRLHAVLCAAGFNFR